MMFLVFSFALITLLVAYFTQRQTIRVMKARDQADAALLILLSAAANLPEASQDKDWQFALRQALTARRFIVRQRLEEEGLIDPKTLDDEQLDKLS